MYVAETYEGEGVRVDEKAVEERRRRQKCRHPALSQL